jgi:prevent-host-death family protein
MKTITAKELRFKTSAVLEEASKGSEVLITLRGNPVAILQPVEKNKHDFKPVGFAMWKDNQEMQDPAKWVDEKRNERTGSTPGSV